MASVTFFLLLAAHGLASASGPCLGKSADLLCAKALTGCLIRVKSGHLCTALYRPRSELTAAASRSRSAKASCRPRIHSKVLAANMSGLIMSGG